MPLADEVLGRYRARKEGGSDKEPPKEKASEGKHASGRALIAAVKRGDAAAVEEAVKACHAYEE